MSSTPAAIFWDRDGTLIDTEPLWGEATYALSEELGRRITPEVRELTVGGSFDNTLRILAEYAGLSLVDVNVNHYRTFMFNRMEQLLEGGIDLNPGVGGVLESLAAAGTPMYVTTNTERVLADRCIDAMGRHFFTDSITGDEVANPKPAPDMYLEAARRASADPEECLVFEDSWAGMTAAVDAGCVVLGLAENVPAGAHRFNPANFEGATAADVVRWYADAVG